jgi:hypothetical protein
VKKNVFAKCGHAKIGFWFAIFSQKKLSWMFFSKKYLQRVHFLWAKKVGSEHFCAKFQPF